MAKLEIRNEIKRLGPGEDMSMGFFRSIENIVKLFFYSHGNVAKCFEAR